MMFEPLATGQDDSGRDCEMFVFLAVVDETCPDFQVPPMWDYTRASHSSQ